MEKIWLSDPSIDVLNHWSKNTLVDHLGIEFTEIGPDYIKATMPVDSRTVQPMRLLHGGASVVLAETIGSTASTLCVDLNEVFCVGASINANHLRSAKTGLVTAIVKPIHLGRSSHVWDIEIFREDQKIVCKSRLTMAIVSHKR